MKAMFVEETGASHYAHWLAEGRKTIETRFKNTLGKLVGERVAIVRTRHGKLPLVVGYCVVTDCWFCPKNEFADYTNQHLIFNEGCKYFAKRTGKYMYEIRHAEKCEPYELPKNAIRHGRSWCEFDERYAS